MDRLLGLLLGVVLLDALVSGVVRLGALRRVLAGEAREGDLLAAVGLVWWLVLIAVALAVLQRLRALQHGITERDATLAGLAESSSDWLWESTPDLVLTYNSPAVHNLLGHRPEEMAGRSLLDYLDPDDVPAARALVAQAIQDGTGWSDQQLRWRHADGLSVLMLGTARPVHDQAGRLVAFRGSRRAVPAESAERRRLAAIVHRTRSVIDERSLSVALQPIVDATTGGLAGLEALARFPDGGPPDRWFAQAHEAGVGAELELAALEAAAGLLPKLPPTAYLSINTSPAVVLDPGFREAVERCAGPWLDRVVVEVTEHAAVTRYEDIQAALLPLRERGLRLAVDDTGAGYASFNHVLRLRPDIIKLDRSLLAGIAEDAARRAVVTAVVLLGLELGASVTGEGVEIGQEFETLRALGVDAVQGYLLARPSTDERVWAQWRDRNWLTHAGIVAAAEAALRHHARQR